MNDLKNLQDSDIDLVDSLLGSLIYLMMFVSAEATCYLLDSVMVCWILLWLLMHTSVRSHLLFTGFDYDLLVSEKSHLLSVGFDYGYWYSLLWLLMIASVRSHFWSLWLSVDSCWCLLLRETSVEARWTIKCCCLLKCLRSTMAIFLTLSWLSMFTWRNWNEWESPWRSIDYIAS